MKKLVLAACAAAALALPAAPAAASEIPPPAGTKPCPAPYVGGYIVWVNTPATGYHEEWFCIPGGPGAASGTGTAATAATMEHDCPPNQVGTVVYYQTPNGWITIHIPLCFGPD